jgi:predicted dehydrogenase
LRLTENCRNLQFLRFEESPNYSSYMEYLEGDLPVSLPHTDPLVEAVGDIVSCMTNGGKPRCSGEDAMKAVQVANAGIASAKAGLPVTLV